MWPDPQWADAMTARRYNPVVEMNDTSSQNTVTRPPNTSQFETLRVSSRALLKENFNESDPFNLPQGHPTIALTENQIYSVLRVVIDETARVFNDMLENMIYRASRLSLESFSAAKQSAKKTA